MREYQQPERVGPVAQPGPVLVRLTTALAPGKPRLPAMPGEKHKLI